MSDPISFTLVFLENYPHEAARALEELNPEQTADFFENISIETGAKVFEKLSPGYAVKCFLLLQPETSGALLQEMRSTISISLLRFISKSMLKSLLETMPEKKQTFLKKRLAFPPDTVGAWMDSDYLTLPDKFSVGKARKLIRNFTRPVEYSPCAVRADGTLAGVLSLHKLSVEKDRLPIKKLLNTDIKPVSDRTSLHFVESMMATGNLEVLPVIDPKNKYVGILTRKELQRGLIFLRGEKDEINFTSIFGEMIHAFTSTLSWLVQSVLSLPLLRNASSQIKETGK